MDHRFAASQVSLATSLRFTLIHWPDNNSISFYIESGLVELKAREVDVSALRDLRDEITRALDDHAAAEAAALEVAA